MLKLGEKIISDIYLGDKKIAKVFLGDKLVYQTGKPIFLDYVIFDGASWIDTGLYGSNNTKIEATYQPTAFENGFYGSYSSGKNFTAYISKSGAWRFGNGAVYHIHTSSIVCDSIQNKDGATVNGKTLSYSAQSDFITASTLTVGKVNGSTFTNFKGNIYGFKVYESEELIQDLRPCIDPNGTVCFYDMVTKKYFYNKGTGTLTAGNVIKFVDYITFDGNSYIDTNVVPVFGDELEITAKIGEAVAGKNYVLFGTGTSSIQFTGLVESGRIFNRYFGTTAGRSVGQDTVTTSHTYLFKNDGSVYQNDKLITSPFTVTEATVNTNLTIGTRGYDTEYWLGNISSAKLIGSDSSIKLDLKPCVVAGEAGFYDMVTGKVFTNAGTGTLKASGRFVKSILFDGASYIDTGVQYQTCTIKTETKFSLTGTRQLMGFSGTSSIHYWGCSASGYLEPLTSVNGLEFKEIEVAYNKDNADNKTLTMTVDGKSTVKTGKIDTTKSYLIGCLDTSSYFAQCEVKYNKIYVNGEVIQDLRPYVDENGVACFKDVVTGNLFYNKGTGTLGYTEE